MLILLIIPFIAVLIYIGSQIKKLDSFLQRNGYIASEGRAPSYAIVFGDTPAAKQVAAELRKRGIEPYALSEPYILERENTYRYAFALSDDDADNILMCKIARKIYGVENIISVCSDESNEYMYRKENIPCILRGGSAESILGFVMSQQEILQ